MIMVGFQENFLDPHLLWNRLLGLTVIYKCSNWIWWIIK